MGRGLERPADIRRRDGARAASDGATASPLSRAWSCHAWLIVDPVLNADFMMRIQSLLIAAAVVFPTVVAAQGSAALGPLAVPDGAPMRCAVAALASGAKPLPPKHVKLEYYFGDPKDPERGITVVFDSAGRAVQLNELTFETRGGRELLIHGITVAFDSTGSAEGFHSVRTRTAPAPNPNAALPILSPEDRAKARELANWLEKHRCDAKGEAGKQ